MFNHSDDLGLAVFQFNRIVAKRMTHIIVSQDG